MVASGLRSALAEAGLTQEAFARLLGTSRPRLSAYLNGRTMPSAALYLRALRTAAALQSAQLHGWMTPDATVTEVNDALNTGDDIWAFKLIIQARDHLATMLDADDPAADAWLLRSHPISDPRYDALLAALVAHEFEQHDPIRTPEWTETPPLHTDWIQPNVRRGVDWTRTHTPTWLARRGIYISTHDLQTA
jgi:transcriptional regulator with XRE-family HTH domain